MRFYKEPPPRFTSLSLSLRNIQTRTGVEGVTHTALCAHAHTDTQPHTRMSGRHLDLVFVVSRNPSAVRKREKVMLPTSPLTAPRLAASDHSSKRKRGATGVVAAGVEAELRGRQVTDRS